MPFTSERDFDASGTQVWRYALQSGAKCARCAGKATSARSGSSGFLLKKL
jgi:hypothetical protein